MVKKKNAITIRIHEYRYKISLPAGHYFLSLDADDFSVNIILEFPLINSTSSNWASAALSISEDGSIDISSDIELYNSTNAHQIFVNDYVFPYLSMVGKIKLIKDIINKNLDLFFENVPIKK